MAGTSSPTTFVVSLFLPYTINFARHESTRKALGTAAAVEPSQPISVLSGHPTLLTKTAPHGSPEEPSKDLFGTQQDDSTTPSFHFARPNNPRTLTRCDVHVPEWGRGRVFNQPLAKESAAPPSTILAYSKEHEQAISSKLDALHVSNLSHARERDSAFIPQRRTPRDVSRDKSISRADWTVQPAIQGNGGLCNAVRAAEEEGILGANVTRIGTLGFPMDDIGLARRDEIIETLESDYDSICVVIGDKDFDSHYRQYCKTILWPVLHYQIPDHPTSKAYQDHSWIYYVKVNEAFAEKIVETYKHGDTIWIHDYHLLLVPAILRQKLPDAKIGFFLHVAFPSSEVFRCLASRTQLLNGVLGANLVAFQTSEYAQHFLQTCSRLLVVETTDRGVQLENHFVEVAHCPIGIVPDQLTAARCEPEVQNWVKTLTSKYSDKVLIVARDKLDSIRGVKQKLLAFEMFLDDNPEWKGRVVLVQVATSTASDQQGLDARVSDIVTRVNAKHSTLDHQPVLFLRQDIAFLQYLALLSAADVLMVTSLREGMNLTSHEYIACQDGSHGSEKKHGPLILSEFAGSTGIFQGHDIAVNPWDYKQMSRAIRYALQMSKEEKKSRYVKLAACIAESNGMSWVEKLQTKLNAAYETNTARDTMSIPRLSAKAVHDAYHNAKHALLILDHEGTLLQQQTPASKVMAPTTVQRLHDTLYDLVSVEGNAVYVTSARQKADLAQRFHDVPRIGLVAENGCFVRPFGQDQWIDLVDTSPEVVADWKEGVLSLLSYYERRQKGSCIEEKQCTVVYHYSNAPENEREAAFKQAGEAANHINDSCQGQRMRAVPLDKAVVIEPYDVDKGTAAQWILQHTYDSVADHAYTVATSAPPEIDYFKDKQEILRESDTFTGPLNHVANAEPLARVDSATAIPPSTVNTSGQPSGPPPSAASMQLTGPKTPWPDFLLVAGDDREDEPLFRWANRLQQKQEDGEITEDVEKTIGDIRDVFSVCVGKKNTEASYTLTQGAMGMVAALQKLTNA